MIPISRPDIGPAEEAGRHRRASLRHARDGSSDAGVRGGVGRVLRRAARRVHGQRHRRPGGGPAGARDRAGRRGHHRQLHVQRDGQRDPRRLARDPYSWTSGPTTSAWIPDRVEAAITPRTKAIMPVHLYGLMADMDPLVEIAQRHGIRDRRGRRPGARRVVPRPPRRPVRAGDVQPVRHQEPDDRRGRIRHDGRRRRSPTGSACTATTGCVSATTTSRSARTSSPPTSPPRSAWPSWPASMSGPRSAARTHARLTEGLRGYLTPSVPEGPRARLAPVHDALPGRA